MAILIYIFFCLNKPNLKNGQSYFLKYIKALKKNKKNKAQGIPKMNVRHRKEKLDIEIGNLMTMK